MDFVAVVDQVIALLRQRGRVTYRTLKPQFTLDDAQLTVLKDELLYSQSQVVDDAGRGLVWTGDAGTASLAPVEPPDQPSILKMYPDTFRWKIAKEVYGVYPDVWATMPPRQGGPRAGWWTVHGPAVLPACIAGSHQYDCGRVTAPRAIL